ncbi:aspartic proteinase Asp1 isoform X1 [Daucus carota subsp. sativus]|nr:PREDICTED: aspartic proteinase Asp1-like isoform X3 [Daucus carota subsp. sativus]
MYLPFLYTLLLLLTSLEQPISAANQPHRYANKHGPSSVIFPVTGNVYPKGYFHVTIKIGHPAKAYFLDIDTGSDLTWLQCDAPCTKCIPAPHTPYKPTKDLVRCRDPLCASLQSPENLPCGTPEEQCDYEVGYADHGSSMGVLVKDFISLTLTNGSILGPRLAFGCGYNQEVADSVHPPYTDGVLGLGKGKSSIVGQIFNLGLTQNVVGHCLSGHGGGFLFLGNDLLPSSGVIWMPMSSKSIGNHYSLGNAELLFGGKATGVKGLNMVFDSGSTYTYFNSQAYKALFSLIKKEVNGKNLNEANDDKSLPVCWKGTKPFRSIRDVSNLFKPLALSFTKSKTAQLQMPPEAYLIVTDKGNVCLGIMDGSEVGLEDFNIIGDISLQDKIVIFDNEKQRIGWATANCERLPKSVDHEATQNFLHSYGVDSGILQDY